MKGPNRLQFDVEFISHPKSPMVQAGSGGNR